MSAPSFRQMHAAGVLQLQAAKRFGWSSISRKGLKQISVVFEETETAGTQEFVLRWSPDGGNSVREIVRQQWNFSPPESTREVEEYQVDLSSVTIIELVIKPNIGGGLARRITSDEKPTFSPSGRCDVCPRAA